MQVYSTQGTFFLLKLKPIAAYGRNFCRIACFYEAGNVDRLIRISFQQYFYANFD